MFWKLGEKITGQSPKPSCVPRVVPIQGSRVKKFHQSTKVYTVRMAPHSPPAHVAVLLPAGFEVSHDQCPWFAEHRSSVMSLGICSLLVAHCSLTAGPPRAAKWSRSPQGDHDMAEEGHQGASEMTQDVRPTAPGAPNTAQEGPETAQDARRRPLRTPTGRQDGPMGVQSAPNRPPRRPHW
eukprot:1465726-Pyramimonas_sp.AAC.1